MTRETKAGLVVSGSFLCLVGLVLYFKLQNQGNGSADAYTDATSVKAPDDPVPVSEKDNPQGDQQTTGLSNGSPWPGSPGKESVDMASTGGDSGKLNSDPSISASHEKSNDSESGNKDREDSHASNNIHEDSHAGGYQIPASEPEEKADLTKSTEAYSSDPSAKEKSSKKSDEVDQPENQKKNEPRDTSKASLSLNIEEQIKRAIKNAPAGSANSAKSDSPKEIPTTFGQHASESVTQTDKNQTGAVNSGTDLEPPPVPSQYKDKDPYHTLPKDPPKAVSAPAAPPAPGKYTRDQGLKKAAPSEAPGIKLHVPETVPGTSQVKVQGIVGADSTTARGPATPKGLQTPGVMPSPLVTPPPAGDTAPEPRVLLGKPTPEGPSSNQLAQGSTEGQQNAPGGFSTPATAGPLAGPTNPSGKPAQEGEIRVGDFSGGARFPLGKPGQPAPIVPRVESYDEETYICKAGDTFAGISSRYYYTDKYALALLRFNRNHPRAAVGIAQEPPVLQAGQPVYIPPLRILEKQYLSAPADSNAVMPAGGPSPALPRDPMPPGKSPPSGERTYQVPERGEMFLEIAKKTLGNADRWGEIWRLNPQYDPKYVVPAGTNLRLPADARIAVPGKTPSAPEARTEGSPPNPSR